MKLIYDSDSLRKDIRTKRLIEMEGGNLRTAAKKAGVSVSTLCRVENGKIPDLMTYAKVCAWLGISMDKHIKKSK